MSENEMVLGIVSMVFGTGIVITVLNTVKSVLVGRAALPKNSELVTEVRALRDEIRQLRQQNNDVILAMDTTNHRMEHRLERLENRLGPGSAQAPSEQIVGRH